MPVRLVILTLVMLACFVMAMAAYRGRDSRYFHLLSTTVSPLSQQFLPAPDKAIALPFQENFEADLDPSWRWFKPEHAVAARREGQLSLAATRESVWWNNSQGPMLYRYLRGNASISLSVRTRKQSFEGSAPDMEWQFGGIILRDPRGDAWLSRENYVFNVVGFRKKGLQVETKSTKNGISQVDSWDWSSGDAHLKIERNDARFTMYSRETGSGSWQRLTSYDRPDLPNVLQVGLIMYAFSEGRGLYDVKVLFDQLEVE